MHIQLVSGLVGKTFGIDVVFASFYEATRKPVEQASYRFIYCPEELSKIDPQAVDNRMTEELDRQANEDYGIGINTMLTAERFFRRSKTDETTFVKQHVALLTALIDAHTVCISSMIDHFVFWLASAICKTRGAFYIAFVDVGFPPNFCVALRDPWTCWSTQNSNSETLTLLEVTKSLAIPVEKRLKYMSTLRTPIQSRIRTWWERYNSNRKDQVASSYFAATSNLLLASLKAKIPNRKKRIYFDITLAEQVNSLKVPYAYMPLHLEPEATVLMWSPWCTDQREACRIVAQALPTGWWLLVKENPKMLGIRDPKWYKALSSIPSIRLVDPSVSSTALTQRAQIVVSIAGTAVKEAEALGRTGIFLGRPPYRHLASGCDFAASGFSGLNAALRSPRKGNIERQWNVWLSCCINSTMQPIDNGAVPASLDNIYPLLKTVRAVTSGSAELYPSV